ncbi:ATP-binding cassette domain-containing protein [Homoserinibacter sp. GY 40078]|uniref:ABC transporter ATP-binding protein n=1 Tax=Homoserinibacter sp. GY 40078 TaxID=2603275 RepID=UPI0021062594|nr:ATP-binding cassette domain-containing protein [Homoserinibacter sp. GY 40078]
MPVTLHAVGHRFGDGPWLFRELSTQFEEGRVYALTGPSGSGKSTLLGILAGWTPPAAGEVVREFAGRTAWVFQNPHGSPRRTARDLVAYPFVARGADVAEADAAAAELLDRFGLGHRALTPFRALSGGESQRLMLARAAAVEPALLLVDEPTAQLDPASASTVNAVIGELAGRGAIVVVATHDPATREACTDHLDLARRGVTAEVA